MKKAILILLIFVTFSCDDILEIDDISKENIILLAPANGVSIFNDQVSFSWEAVEEADEYQLQVAKPSFEEAIEIIADTTLSQRTYTQSFEIGDYEWRVRALNSGYKSKYTTRRFTVEEE